MRVAIVDDQALFRDAVRGMLREAGIEVVGEAGNAREAIALAARARPDVVMLDIEMPGINGIQAVYRIAAASPRTRVLMVSAYGNREYVLEALGEAKAAGFVLKSDTARELLLAIEAVGAGKTYISPSVAPAVLEKLRSPKAGEKASADPLTRREREVVKLIADGATAKEIAQALGISAKTVQVHRTNAAAKLGVRSRADLVKYAIKHRLTRVG